MEKLPVLNLDELIFCGDIFGYYYGQKEILDILTNLTNLHWILGNHERYYLDMIEGRRNSDELVRSYGSSYSRIQGKISLNMQNLLRGLSPETHLQFGNIILYAVHGTLADPLEGRLYPQGDIGETAHIKVRILIMGHTHFRMCKQVDKILLINSGSLGQPRDNCPAGLAILTLPECNVEFIDIDYDRVSLENEIRNNDPENKKLIDILHRAG
jgi:predicted phosphodiesterase